VIQSLDAKKMNAADQADLARVKAQLGA